MKKLELKQMEKLQGGVPVEEYCNSLRMVIKHNISDMSEGSIEAAWCAYMDYCL